MHYIASVSFGKDSLAMLLLLIKKQYKIDEVIFYDTGMEFQAIYNTRNKVKELLEKQEIKYTELSPKQDFLYKMLEKKYINEMGLFNMAMVFVEGNVDGEQRRKTSQ